MRESTRLLLSTRIVRAVVALVGAALIALPVPVVTAAASSGTSVVRITAGGLHTCAVTSVGSVKCWGANTYGQLGNGVPSNGSPTPVDVAGLASGVTAIASGNYHTCAVASAGGVECWGRNQEGALGNGSIAPSGVPVGVTGLASGVSAVAGDVLNSCALTTAGAVKCWGYNAYGQLGNDSTVESRVPVNVSGLSSGVTAVGVGTQHACALTNAGGVACWGAGTYLGNTPTRRSLTPAGVAGLGSGVAAIDVGDYHTCVITSAGGVKCWGENSYGELGIGTTFFSFVPVDVSGLTSGVTATAAGRGHTCALTSTGGVMCWGWNKEGQLGNGSRTDSLIPVDVVGLTSGVAAIAAGQQHTCAVMKAGGLKCWGWGAAGQLGNGSMTSSSTPVDVLFSANSATGTTNAWSAKVGTSGANGTVSLSAVTNGVGSIGLKLVKLRASTALPVALYKGTCASVGVVLLRLASVRTTSTGAASRTNSLTAAQVKLIVAATAGSSKIAIRVGSGASAKCGAFAKRSILGPQAVVQAFYNWYIAQVGVAKLRGRPDLTPAFISWAEHYNDGTMFGADPILCAQDGPESVKAGPATISGATATVQLTEAFGDPQVLAVKLILGPTGWQISANGCGS